MYWFLSYSAADILRFDLWTTDLIRFSEIIDVFSDNIKTPRNVCFYEHNVDSLNVKHGCR